MLREAGTFIRVNGEMRQLPVYFDNPKIGLLNNVFTFASVCSLT